MSDPLVFEVLVDPAEAVRAGRALEKRARTTRSQWLWTGAFAIPGIAAVILKQWFILGELALLVVAIMLGAFVGPILRRSRLRRAYAATPALQGSQRYELSDDGLVMSNVGASVTLRWTAMPEVAETSDFFLFYYSPKCAYYLPKRLIVSESQRKSLRALVRAHLGPRAEHLG